MIIKQAILDSGWGPGGWIYHQEETNWDAPNPLANNFAKQVENIIKHREANPRFGLATDVQTVSRELEEFTIARWRRTYSHRGIQKFLENPEVEKKKNQSNDSFLSWSSAVAAVGHAVGADTDTLEEWLGAGGTPVSLSRATMRAMTCEGCRGNQRAGWRDLLTAGGAEALRTYLSAKSRMGLYTPLDGKLGICKVCKCYLPLKVWTPLQHIKNTMSKEHWDALSDMNPVCWIRQE